MSHNRLVEEAFDANQLVRDGSHWCYKGIRAKNIVFAKAVTRIITPFLKTFRLSQLREMF